MKFLVLVGYRCAGSNVTKDLSGTRDQSVRKSRTNMSPVICLLLFAA